MKKVNSVNGCYQNGWVNAWQDGYEQDNSQYNQKKTAAIMGLTYHQFRGLYRRYRNQLSAGSIRKWMANNASIGDRCRWYRRIIDVSKAKAENPGKDFGGGGWRKWCALRKIWRIKRGREGSHSLRQLVDQRFFDHFPRNLSGFNFIGTVVNLLF